MASTLGSRNKVSKFKLTGASFLTAPGHGDLSSPRGWLVPPVNPFSGTWALPLPLGQLHTTADHRFLCKAGGGGGRGSPGRGRGSRGGGRGSSHAGPGRPTQSVKVAGQADRARTRSISAYFVQDQSLPSHRRLQRGCREQLIRQHHEQLGRQLLQQLSRQHCQHPQVKLPLEQMLSQQL